jgi:hypothetical protein
MLKGPSHSAREIDIGRMLSGRFTEKPTLIWPSIPDHYQDKEYDRYVVPPQLLTDKRHQHCYNRNQLGVQSLGCNAFWQKVVTSQILLILDSHFDKAAMRALRDELEKGRGSFSDLRVICAERDAHSVFDDVKKRLRRTKRIMPGGTIDMRCWTRGAPPHIHDRFAVTDHELWHFGGTVGGLHQDLTAVSRGWEASSHRFLKFFDEVWAQLA